MHLQQCFQSFCRDHYHCSSVALPFYLKIPLTVQGHTCPCRSSSFLLYRPRSVRQQCVHIICQYSSSCLKLCHFSSSLLLFSFSLVALNILSGLENKRCPVRVGWCLWTSGTDGIVRFCFFKLSRLHLCSRLVWSTNSTYNRPRTLSLKCVDANNECQK
jgi:hypothetical protein